MTFDDLVQAGKDAMEAQATESVDYSEIETGYLQIRYYNAVMVNHDTEKAEAIKAALARRGWVVDQETPRHNPSWTYTRKE